MYVTQSRNRISQPKNAPLADALSLALAPAGVCAVPATAALTDSDEAGLFCSVRRCQGLSVNSAAHSAVNSGVWSCWGQLGSQHRPDNPHPWRLCSASNRKQTPLIADSCLWLMILIQFSKPVFFSFAPSEIFHQCCHGQLVWLLCTGIKAGWENRPDGSRAECLTCTRAGKQAWCLLLEPFSLNQTRLRENVSYFGYAFTSACINGYKDKNLP